MKKKNLRLVSKSYIFITTIVQLTELTDRNIKHMRRRQSVFFETFIGKHINKFIF